MTSYFSISKATLINLPTPVGSVFSSGRPQRERLNAVVQFVLVPRWTRPHESTNRAGQPWDKPGHDDGGWIKPNGNGASGEVAAYDDSRLGSISRASWRRATARVLARRRMKIEPGAP